MSFWMTLTDFAFALLVAFMAGVYVALWRDDDRGAFDEPEQVQDERRRAA